MAEGSKAEDRACSTLLHRLILRVPKATLDILGAYADVVCVCTVVCVRLHCCVLIAATSIPLNLPP